MILRRLLVACIVIAAALPAAAAGGGNSDNAHLCQAHWPELSQVNGTSFKNQGACVSYAAKGGILATFTTSTSEHTTHTRIDQAVELYSTRVIGLANDPQNHVVDRTVFDQTLTSAPASAEVQTAFEEAIAAVTTFLQASGSSGQVHVSPPALLSSSQTSQTSFVGAFTDHVEVTTQTTATVGPAQILVGPGPTVPFTVLTGTTNFDTRTHTETFMYDLYRTTTTHFATYVVTGVL